MTIFPNAKINIGLRIIFRRSDGFHNIETIFYPVMLRDALEFTTYESGNDSDSLTVTGIDTKCKMSDNLAVRAVNMLRETYNIPALQIHLHKTIPIGAGLGGGSSDASFMLRYLNRYFRLGLCNGNMKKLSARLGSDCPFFIENTPAYAEGRGDILKKVSPKLQGYHIVIVYPGINVNSGDAFRRSLPSRPETNLLELFNLPIEEWRGNIINDFEPLVSENYAQISEIILHLYEMGAIYSSMSGSGSSVYGIFRDKPPQISLKGNYFNWTGIL
jgi:4-diphosphocytidyl-2-C-methyl-D-erythritol kinase